MTPLHKKGKKDKKDNYRPVSILPTLSKCFEKCMFSQMYDNACLSKYFRNTNMASERGTVLNNVF